MIRVRVLDSKRNATDPYYFEIRRDKLTQYSRIFGEAINNSHGGEIKVDTTPDIWNLFVVWVHQNKINHLWNKAEDDFDSFAVLIGFYIFALEYEVEKLCRDVMKCFLQRFEDGYIPSERALPQIEPLLDHLSASQRHATDNPLVSFMMAMVMHFMPQISYNTWSTLSRVAHTYYVYCRERLEETQKENYSVVKSPDEMREAILDDWCIWHGHDVNEDRFIKESPLVQICRDETRVQRSDWKAETAGASR